MKKWTCPQCSTGQFLIANGQKAPHLGCLFFCLGCKKYFTFDPDGWPMQLADDKI